MIVSDCLKCGYRMKYVASLCLNCLEEEFDKMDHGDQSGYLYATELYLKRELKKQRDDNERRRI